MTIDQEFKISKRMEKYKESEFRLYLDETGWEDWMDEFVSDGEPTESEIKTIEDIQKNIWWMVFN